MNFFQVREKSGNFVDGQGNLGWLGTLRYVQEGWGFKQPFDKPAAEKLCLPSNTEDLHYNDRFFTNDFAVKWN